MPVMRIKLVLSAGIEVEFLQQFAPQILPGTGIIMIIILVMAAEGIGLVLLMLVSMILISYFGTCFHQ